MATKMKAIIIAVEYTQKKIRNLNISLQKNQLNTKDSNSGNKGQKALRNIKREIA